MIDYADSDSLTVLDKVVATSIFAHSNAATSAAQDLEVGASGNILLNTNTIELNGDTVFNSNIAVNSSVFVGDMNIFRTFDDGHTITYGMRIGDTGKLQIFKNDSRQNKSTLVNEFGGGTIGAQNTTFEEQITGKLNGMYNKAKNVNRRVG